MKLLVGNGRELLVYDVTGPVYRIASAGAPVKRHGHEIMSDDAARDELQRILAAGGCRGERPEVK